MVFFPLAIIVVVLAAYVVWFLYKRSVNKQKFKSPEKSGNSSQKTSKVNFCGECGTALAGSERFCGKCGAEVIGI